VAWLEERKVAGIIGFHTSLAGHGEIHDRWNGRAGDFDYQTSILRLAGERGMTRQEKLFLAQNTLPIFDCLLISLMTFRAKSVAGPQARFSTPAWQPDTKLSA